MADPSRKRIDHFREAVWSAPDLTSTEKLVLQAMTKWMDFDTLGRCMPGHKAVQDRTSLSKRTVERTVAAVVAKGWLVEEHRGGAFKGATKEASVYRGAIPTGVTESPVGGADWRQDVASTGVTVSQDWRQGDAPPSQVPGAPDGAGAPGSVRRRSRRRPGRQPCTRDDSCTGYVLGDDNVAWPCPSCNTSARAS